MGNQPPSGAFDNHQMPASSSSSTLSVAAAAGGEQSLPAAVPMVGAVPADEAKEPDTAAAAPPPPSSLPPPPDLALSDAKPVSSPPRTTSVASGTDEQPTASVPTTAAAAAVTPERPPDQNNSTRRTNPRIANGCRDGHPKSSNSNKSNNRQCRVHCPTLEELQSQSFSTYVRATVLSAVTVYDEDDYVPNDQKDKDDAESGSSGDNSSDQEPQDYLQESSHQVEWTEGIARVRLPPGFCRTADSIANDPTGRGPAWQAESRLGDLRLPSPMEQRVLGMAGIYEYTFLDRPALTVAEFRDQADAYQRAQLRGSFAYQKQSQRKNNKDEQQQQEEELSDEQCEALEALFWKRLGPTMPPAWYGADMEGSLFAKDDEASGWSVRNLDSCLRVLSNLPGVTSSYLYAGMWASVFCAHTEDMNLLSINYLHAGAPKIWYAVAPGKDAARFEALLQSYFPQQHRACPEFLRHKRYMVSPKILQKAGIAYTTTIQRPGDAVITFPGGYHWGFNAGFNMAEATNFAVAEWLPYGREAKVCLCRPDSVRIDMRHVTLLLQKFQKDQDREPSLTWAEWSRRREEPENEEGTASCSFLEPEQATAAGSSSDPRKEAKRLLSEQQKKLEFWIEVMKPVASKKAGSLSSKKKKKAHGGQLGNNRDSAGRSSGRKRKKSQKVLQAEELAREEAKLKRRRLKQQQRRANEIWHLAKPIGRKSKLELNTRVLCIVPATRLGDPGSDDSSDDSDTDDDILTREHCFCGHVVEREVDGHVRVRLEGLPRSEDLWLPCDNESGQLFLDGGQWSADDFDRHKTMIGKKHYWDVCDSQQREID